MNTYWSNNKHFTFQREAHFLEEDITGIKTEIPLNKNKAKINVKRSSSNIQEFGSKLVTAKTFSAEKTDFNNPSVNLGNSPMNNFGSEDLLKEEVEFNLPNKFNPQIFQNKEEIINKFEISKTENFDRPSTINFHTFATKNSAKHSIQNNKQKFIYSSNLNDDKNIPINIQNINTQKNLGANFHYDFNDQHEISLQSKKSEKLETSPFSTYKTSQNNFSSIIPLKDVHIGLNKNSNEYFDKHKENFSKHNHEPTTHEHPVQSGILVKAHVLNGHNKNPQTNFKNNFPKKNSPSKLLFDQISFKNLDLIKTPEIESHQILKPNNENINFHGSLPQENSANSKYTSHSSPNHDSTNIKKPIFDHDIKQNFKNNVASTLPKLNNHLKNKNDFHNPTIKDSNQEVYFSKIKTNHNKIDIQDEINQPHNNINKNIIHSDNQYNNKITEAHSLIENKNKKSGIFPIQDKTVFQINKVPNNNNFGKNFPVLTPFNPYTTLFLPGSFTGISDTYGGPIHLPLQIPLLNLPFSSNFGPNYF